MVRDWHMVLLVTGLPGLLLALVMFLSVKEPARRDRKSHGSVPLREVLRFLGLNRKFYAPLFLSIAIASVESYGLQASAGLLRSTYAWGPDGRPLLGGALRIAMLLGLYLGTVLAEYRTSQRPKDARLAACRFPMASRWRCWRRCR